ncbi:sialoadhesin-like isoform 2-T3 [Anomaloglossus baeobatrachus]|uniref:sialoadhesin-like isoform X2 n=1 Tax=Anomaloglossus baeobatrachus TaxID=238106 RepID=UPI003F50ADC3
MDPMKQIYLLLICQDSMDIQLLVPIHLTEGEATTIRCTVKHTCRSSPPSLQWNKPGQVHHQSVEISKRSWREESNLTYIPSYLDDGTNILCTATYPNGRSFLKLGMLNITSAPKNVTVAVLAIGEVMEGSDVTLQCNSSSKSKVNKYEWYKGKDKAKLPETGREITVRNVTRDVEPYSCAAINDVGRGESALMEIPVLLSSSYGHIIIPTTIVTICLLLLVLLVYACWRKKQKKQERTETEATYTDLRRSEITETYEQLKPLTPADSAPVGSEVETNDVYENVH